VLPSGRKVVEAVRARLAKTSGFVFAPGAGPE
jgi:hypothetical protein